MPITINYNNDRMLETIINIKNFALKLHSKINYDTPHYAVKNNSNIYIVKKKLNKENYNIHKFDKYGYNALHWAVMYRKSRMIEFLLENGADINAKNKYGYNALHWAVMYRKPRMIEFLLENGADINAKNKYGDNALHILLIFITNEHIKFKNVMFKNDNEFKYFLHRTKETVACLLKHGININERTKEKYLAIDMAKMQPDLKEIETTLLLHHNYSKENERWKFQEIVTLSNDNLQDYPVPSTTKQSAPTM